MKEFSPICFISFSNFEVAVFITIHYSSSIICEAPLSYVYCRSIGTICRNVVSSLA